AGETANAIVSTARAKHNRFIAALPCYPLPPRERVLSEHWRAKRVRGCTRHPLPQGESEAFIISYECRSSRSRQITEAFKIVFLLLIARRQLEQPRRGAAENIVLALFRQERQVPDRRRQVEIPVRIIRRIKELRLRIHHAERALHCLVILNLHRL